MTQKLPFVPGNIYRRQTDIHDKFGGSRQNGISPSKEHPYIFIFTGKTGQQHGYTDEWNGDSFFSYTGEGQKDNMRFIRGNRALRDHQRLGKRILLFESVQKGIVKFINEMEYHDYGYDIAPDTDGKSRQVIKFILKPKDSKLPSAYIKTKNGLLTQEPLLDPTFKVPDKTERQGLVTSRIGQGAYRKRVLYRWNLKCAVTGYNNINILIASHIVPWASSTNQERTDVYNGILLSPNYDALFDKHLISFENSGKIILSPKIHTEDLRKLGITGEEKIKGLDPRNYPYLERHRKTFYESH